MTNTTNATLHFNDAVRMTVSDLYGDGRDADQVRIFLDYGGGTILATREAAMALSDALIAYLGVDAAP